VPPTGPAADFAAALRARLPAFETARLVLRAPEIGDFAAYAEILCSPRASGMGGQQDREGAWSDFTATIAGWLLRGHGLWTVAAKADGAVLGFVLVNMEAGDREPELGFFLREAAEGKGYAFEAAMAARDHALKVLKLDRLVSYIAPGNVRSQALARRLGAWHDAAADFDGVEVWRHWPPAADDGGMEAYA
jgi:RimJ/RimL family protein N-acetyltransferase